ncbi:MAG: nucleotide pyrophosphohydrolase [Opitutae bacterium]|nr:nucleotide pyrophosphohydrolase [Opitutae bacterium]|tara:strand:- start:10598 stop:11275 length:678 start_codon:yes stop_codon:yes gene_type:complete
MSEIQRLREIVAQLRAPDGCPWDKEQTHESLVRCMIEEVSETLEAIDNQDYQLMEEELGDLLLQVVFHALLAEEQSKFDLEDVARGINQKLIRRHPHVFGNIDDKMKSSQEVLDRWEAIKAQEKKERGIVENGESIFKNLPPRLPALLFAYDVYKRAHKNGLEKHGDWDEELLSKNSGTLNEEKAGKALFEWVGACRESGIDPESALRKFAASQVEKLDRSTAAD